MTETRCAAVVLAASPEVVTIVQAGHAGYWPLPAEPDPRSTARRADHLNEMWGVTPSEREALLFSSMFPGSPERPERLVSAARAYCAPPESHS